MGALNAADFTVPLLERMDMIFRMPNGPARHEEFVQLADDLDVLRDPQGVTYIGYPNDLMLFRFGLSQAKIEIDAVIHGRITVGDMRHYLNGTIHAAERIEVHLMPDGMFTEWISVDTARGAVHSMGRPIPHYPLRCPVRWMSHERIELPDGSVREVWGPMR
jgi:hypothetical protein